MAKFDYKGTVFDKGGGGEVRMYSSIFLVFVWGYLSQVRDMDFWFGFGVAALLIVPFSIGMVRPITWYLIGRNEHIEIEVNRLRFYDFLGKLRVEGDAGRITYVGRELPEWPMIPTKHRLQVDGAEFRVFENLNGFPEFCKLLGLEIGTHN